MPKFDHTQSKMFPAISDVPVQNKPGRARFTMLAFNNQLNDLMDLTQEEYTPNLKTEQSEMLAVLKNAENDFPTTISPAYGNPMPLSRQKSDSKIQNHSKESSFKNENRKTEATGSKPSTSSGPPKNLALPELPKRSQSPLIKKQIYKLFPNPDNTAAYKRKGDSLENVNTGSSLRNLLATADPNLEKTPKIHTREMIPTINVLTPSKSEPSLDVSPWSATPNGTEDDPLNSLNKASGLSGTTANLTTGARALTINTTSVKPGRVLNSSLSKLSGVFG